MESISIRFYQSLLCHLWLQNQLRQRKLGKIKAKPGPSCTSSRSTRPVSWPTSSLELAWARYSLKRSLELFSWARSPFPQRPQPMCLSKAPSQLSLRWAAVLLFIALHYPSPLSTPLRSSLLYSSLLFSTVLISTFSALLHSSVFWRVLILLFSGLLFCTLLYAASELAGYSSLDLLDMTFHSTLSHRAFWCRLQWLMRLWVVATNLKPQSRLSTPGTRNRSLNSCPHSKMEQKCSQRQQKLVAVAFAQPFRCTAPLREFQNTKARAHRGNPKSYWRSRSTAHGFRCF